MTLLPTPEAALALWDSLTHCHTWPRYGSRRVAQRMTPTVPIFPAHQNVPGKNDLHHARSLPHPHDTPSLAPMDPSDPFHTGSHASSSKGMCQIQAAGHEVTMHTLPGRHWKWRMHGAAATWAPLMKDAQPPHVVITTDMCDVAQLKGLMPRTWRDVQVVTMFHENQLTFPWSPDDPDRDNGRDNTYAYVNLNTVMASDQVWFNSQHHMNVFFEAAQQWMDSMPKPHVTFRSRSTCVNRT